MLAHVIRNLTSRGFGFTFIGKNLKFKAGPGKIKLSDPHFQITPPSSSAPTLSLTKSYRLFVDIEFETLGAGSASAADLSCYHEIDIVIVEDVTSNRPKYNQILMGVECKSGAIGKSTLKEVLGIRRELSFLQPATHSSLSDIGGVPIIDVPAYPPSEYWLAFQDPNGWRYSSSPAMFGIHFIELRP